MNVELKLSTDQDAHIIKNLWPLYQHDVSEFDASKPNRHGLFGVDDSVTTLAEHSKSLDAWWKDPQSLFPYLILVNGYPAGFNLAAARSRLPESIQADFVVHEFFVLHAYRGKGIGERAGPRMDLLSTSESFSSLATTPLALTTPTAASHRIILPVHDQAQAT
jgi:predicted acetyltransferase